MAPKIVLRGGQVVGIEGIADLPWHGDACGLYRRLGYVQIKMKFPRGIVLSSLEHWAGPRYTLAYVGVGNMLSPAKIAEIQRLFPQIGIVEEVA